MFRRFMLVTGFALIAATLVGLEKDDVVQFSSSATTLPSHGGFVSVIDGKHLWVGLAYSADGGHSWKEFSPPAATPSPFLNVSPEYQPTTFITDEKGFLRGYESVWMTRDGGHNWSKLFEGRGGVIFQTKSVGGAAVWDNLNQRLNHYISRDSGDTWKKCGESPLSEIAPSGSESFISEEIGWSPVALFDDKQLPGRNGIGRTDDAGCHWRLLAWYDTDRVGRTTYVDASVGWLLPADPGPIALTSDGGLHWRKLNQPTPDFNPVAGYLQDRRSGWLLGFSALFQGDDSGMYFTADLGETWHAISNADLKLNKGRARDIPLSWSEGYFKKIVEQNDSANQR
jgi:photosystem II stability/assembly factor-like uncharacterized protein